MVLILVNEFIGLEIGMEIDEQIEWPAEASGGAMDGSSANKVASTISNSSLGPHSSFFELVRSNPASQTVGTFDDGTADLDDDQLSFGSGSEAEDTYVDFDDMAVEYEAEGVLAQAAKEDFTAHAGVELGTMHRKMSEWEQIRARLQYLQRPKDPLLCREQEHETLYKLLISLLTPLDAHDNVQGGVVFLAGVPGTGKTATTRIVAEAVAQKLRNTQSTSSIVQTAKRRSFHYLECNAFKLSHPRMVFSHLWSAINWRMKKRDFMSNKEVEVLKKNARLGADSAKQKLDAFFKGDLDAEYEQSGEKRLPILLLLDEIETLMTKDQEVLYTVFEWSRLPTSKLVIVGIANMLDLAEKVHQKINSRLGTNRIIFHPYQPSQLRRILEQKMEGHESYFADSTVLDYMAKKVGSSKGDARLTFEVCSRSLRFAELQSLAQDPSGSTIVPVDSKIVDEVIFAMRDNARQAALHSVPLHDRVWILAVLFDIGSRRYWRSQVTDAQRDVISHSALLQLDDDVTYFNVSHERYIQFTELLLLRPLPESSIQASAKRIFQNGVFTTIWQDRSLLHSIYLKLDPEIILNAFISDPRLKSIFTTHNFGRLFDIELATSGRS